jgi:acetolactate synthase-1/2/3 large subunit
MQRVADYIADYIHKLGVKDVFMVSGGGMMFLSDGLAMKPEINVVCTHHEQGAAMAAVGYAKYTESFGVAYITTGCGGTNAVTGLLDAWQDNVPCIFVSGQCKRKETVRNSGLPLRQFGVQEVDIIAVVEPLTKYAVMVNEPEKIAWHLDKAVYLARTGRPGPVWLDIPMDVQGAMIDEAKLERFDPATEPADFHVAPSADDLDTVAGLLAKSQRPIIVAGQGIRLAGAIPAFRKFIEASNIPVVASRLGIDMLPSDHPLFIGRIGNKGDRAGNFAVQNADLVLVLGSRLSVSSTGHEYQTFARGAKMVIVDIDPVEHRKNTVRMDLFINADVGKFLAALRLPQSPVSSSWMEKCLEWKRKWPVCLPEYAKSKEVNLYYFTDCLTRKMKSDAALVSDAGSAFYVVSQGGQFNQDQRYVTSGGQADMGYSLPAAVGVSVARHRGEVLAVTGDGSFQMNIQELQTVVHNRLPVKLFVWNNDGYLSIRASQSKFFEGRFIGTDSSSGVSFPDTGKIAAAYGIKFFKVNESSELPAVLDQVLAYDGPAICEVICIRDQEIVPTVSSWKKPDGTMVSRPLEDMYPFLDRVEFRKEMIVEPLPE